MKPFIKHLIAVALLTCGLSGYAQEVSLLIKEGAEFANKHQYTEAIDKYRSALALEPDNSNANYQMAFSLDASGKGTEAIPYLKKVTASNASPAIISSAYSLLGSIYDKTAQPQNAIDNYQQAIKAASENYKLYYNLALAYFRARRYSEAEESVLKVLNIEPKHPGSVRLYALVTFHQNKRAPALLALCHFLSLEPNGPSSAEAYGNLQSILKGGKLKLETGEKPPVVDAANRELNQAITRALIGIDKGSSHQATILSKQLSAVFNSLKPIAEKQNGNTSFLKNLTEHYYMLEQSDRMLAFANYISQSVDKSAAVWVKAHTSQLSEPF